jgi:hypothetical protein
MTLLDAGREFTRLTSGLALPRDHVDLLQCVLNNSLGRMYQAAMNAWLSIPQEKRSRIPQPIMDRLIALLQFFEDTSDAARTGESPAMSLQKQQLALSADTEDDLDIVPLTQIEEVVNR